MSALPGFVEEDAQDYEDARRGAKTGTGTKTGTSTWPATSDHVFVPWYGGAELPRKAGRVR